MLMNRTTRIINQMEKHGQWKKNQMAFWSLEQQRRMKKDFKTHTFNISLTHVMHI